MNTVVGYAYAMRLNNNNNNSLKAKYIPVQRVQAHNF